MENSISNLNPIKDLERIQSLDVMRGIVLCGILLMNINGFGLAESYIDPTIAGGSTGLSLYTWITANMLFEGTMRALFSLLFGVGMFMLLDRLDKKGAGIAGADIYFRRLMWLLFLGIIHGYLLVWQGEILYNYALMGFFVFSFRRLAPQKLILAAVILFTIGGIWNYFEYRSKVDFVKNVEEAALLTSEGKELTKDLKDATKEWGEIQESRSAEAINFHNESMRKGYFDVVAFNAPFVMKWKTYGVYRYDLWDILSMMLLGIALYKLNVLSAEKSFKFYITMSVIGYVIGLIFNYFETKNILVNNFSYISFYKSAVTYDLGRIPIAFGHIGLIMIFCKLSFFQWIKSGIAAIGKMALTNYLMHSLICLIVFTGVGFGLFGKLERYELLYVVFGIWVFQFILSPIWLKYYHFGPVEYLWRNLTYLKKHKFRRVTNFDQ